VSEDEARGNQHEEQQDEVEGHRRAAHAANEDQASTEDENEVEAHKHAKATHKKF
jgi:hypothetical protein